MPNKSFPLSITGIASPIKRIPVEHDCGNSIPAGPSTCKLGFQIAPTTGGKVNQLLSIDYQGRIPLTRKIAFTAVAPATLIYTHAKIQTINRNMSTAQAVAIRGSKIIGVGSNFSMLQQFNGPGTTVIDIKGVTILPGFIATHQHAFAWGIYTNPNWIDVSSVNVLLKPPANDPRCQDPSDYQSCFIPVQTQADVKKRLEDAIPTPNERIFAFNYDPARLGACAEGVGFQCDNFENGKARMALDSIPTTKPIMVTSESGHIVYVNTEYLKILNICGTDVAVSPCVEPIFNKKEEKKMANLGQLNEDLALYAENNASAFIDQLDPQSNGKMLENAIAVMQEHGFTLIQEGAADINLMKLWVQVTKKFKKFPMKVALFAYESTTATVDLAVTHAKQIQAMIGNDPNVFIAAIKMFADSSTQGYTGYMSAPYYQLFYPFNSSLFHQPYRGLFDSNQSAITEGAKTAHNANFPLAIHQNGDAAIANALNGLKAAQRPPQKFRDILIHFSLATEQDIDAALAMGVASTFLMENIYYYGLPMCHQVLGPSRTKALYPAGMAARKGLRFGLHSDTPVSPPYPLFAIWVAKTRNTQQPSWYPNKKPTQCPIVMGRNQSISIAQGIKAFTIDAAWTYGLDKEMGSIEAGKEANFVFLSQDPLSMENHPDDLKNIHVLATMHRGQYFANPNAAQPPIWPE